MLLLTQTQQQHKSDFHRKTPKKTSFVMEYRLCVVVDSNSTTAQNWIFRRKIPGTTSSAMTNYIRVIGDCDQ